MAEVDTHEKRDESSNERSARSSNAEPVITILDCFRLVFGLLLLNSLLSYFVTGDSYSWNYHPWWLRPKALAAKLRSPVVLTDAQLLKYDGRDPSLPVYLALNSTIYDVTAGRLVYGPGGPYSFFAGRDATRGFITGCFADDNIPDYRGAEWTFIPVDVPRYEEVADEAMEERQKAYRREMIEKGKQGVDETIRHWAKMFRGETGKDYFEVGYVKRNRQLMLQRPVPTLCQPAESKRPKKSQQKVQIEGAAQAANAGKKEL
ncbi:cytochrome b5-like Heme/Steroid binding domain-containing protein [Zymoseptoria brevis]|uniref:Cytochrome b5-like Heme/Steroid binding domain-containing protein n=1 Tax=Zymoseptoria brevis TaxID=1047168 RepID=A0A0F4GYF7_9PEZI|nr:cytochrome b5-like Heme/Steroid binding domain-containing protein [Zymoseptoria brevis]